LLTSSLIRSFYAGFEDDELKPEISNVYGPTECCVDSTIGHITGKEEIVTIGKGFAGRKVYVLNENGKV